MSPTAKTNIVLIGLMGAGKSSVAKRLGLLLKREVISTDALIEDKEGKAIRDIFKDEGEAYFRALEKETVRAIADRTDVIIDCGGGVVLDQKNIVHLKRNGVLIYLKASPKFLYQCIKNKKNRPLLNVKDPLARIKLLLEQRKSKYEQADITIVSENKTIDEICDEILELIKND